MKSVFGGVDPNLSAVRLTGIDAGERGSGVRLKMALTSSWVDPSVRWQRMSANAVSIELQCFGLEELSVAMQPGDSTVSCEITRDEAGHRVLRVVGPSIDLVIRCGSMSVNHILPYTADYPVADS
jgi:hypothetical protein